MTPAGVAPAPCSGTVETHHEAALRQAILEATSAMRRGCVREALSIMAPQEERLAASTPAHSSPADRLLAAAILVECHLALGDVAAASGAAAMIEGPVEAPEAGWIEYARGEVATALGDTSGAVDHYRAAGAAGADDLAPCPPWRNGLALALAGLGRGAEAESWAREQHRRALRAADPLGISLALRSLAIAGPGGHRVPELRQALALAEQSGNVRIVRQIQADLAGMLVITGESAEATALLRLVEEFAARETLWPLHSRARRFLELVGETPRRLEAEALALLTTAEQRVAVLALDGHRNREIAEQLAVSVKAVESHLSRIYRKMGVTSRPGLLTAVAR